MRTLRNINQQPLIKLTATRLANIDQLAEIKLQVTLNNNSNIVSELNSSQI